MAARSRHPTTASELWEDFIGSSIFVSGRAAKRLDRGGLVNADENMDVYLATLRRSVGAETLLRSVAKHPWLLARRTEFMRFYE
jgi:hypothetical protein